MAKTNRIRPNPFKATAQKFALQPEHVLKGGEANRARAKDELRAGLAENQRNYDFQTNRATAKLRFGLENPEFRMRNE